MRKQSQAGFAIVEMLLILIILGLVAGVGYWVATQRTKTTSSPTAANSTPANSSPAVGTTASIDALLSKETQDEAKADDTATNGVVSSVKTASTAAGNIGDSYNETAY